MFLESIVFHTRLPSQYSGERHRSPSNRCHSIYFFHQINKNNFNLLISSVISPDLPHCSQFCTLSFIINWFMMVCVSLSHEKCTKMTLRDLKKFLFSSTFENFYWNILIVCCKYLYLIHCTIEIYILWL